MVLFLCICVVYIFDTHCVTGLKLLFIIAQSNKETSLKPRLSSCLRIELSPSNQIVSLAQNLVHYYIKSKAVLNIVFYHL